MLITLETIIQVLCLKYMVYGGSERLLLLCLLRYCDSIHIYVYWFSNYA